MTDTDKLKRRADVLRAWNHISAEERDTILALIAENERLKGVNAKRAATIADLVMERDEAVALLRDVGVVSFDVARVNAFLACIDAAA